MQNDSAEIFFAIHDQMKLVEDLLDTAVGSSQVSLICEAAKHIIFSGGKRLRPAIAILCSKICGYPGTLAPQLGVSIELIHTASIIHDDVLDSAELRRGVRTANMKWGNHISILVGDYCLSLANQILYNNFERKIISVLTEGAIRTTEGEILEVTRSNDLSLDVESYLKIIELKTAHLISAACIAGAYLADAPERLSNALGFYGKNLGIAFQITDDILDYTIDSDRLGKKSGTDLKEGKLTLPIIFALERCETGEKKLIKESLLSSVGVDDHFCSIVNILNDYNCIQDAHKVAKKYLELANDSLSPFKPSLEKDLLIKLNDLVAVRKR